MFPYLTPMLWFIGTPFLILSAATVASSLIAAIYRHTKRDN